MLKIDTSIIGELSEFQMPYPEIYHVIGELHTGYIVPVNYSGTILSKEALDAGMKYGDHLYYLETKVPILEYEILKHQMEMATDPGAKLLLKREIEMCEQFGRLTLSTVEYFGSFIPPENCNPTIELDNGIFFCQRNDQWNLCVQTLLCSCEISEYALSLGEKDLEYQYFKYPDFLIVLYELKDYDGIAGLDINFKRLVKDIRHFFPDYTGLESDSGLAG